MSRKIAAPSILKYNPVETIDEIRLATAFDLIFRRALEQRAMAQELKESEQSIPAIDSTKDV